MKIFEVLKNTNFERAKVGSSPYLEIGDINIENKKYSYKEKESVSGAVIAHKNCILVSTVRPTRGAITILREDEVAVSNAFAILDIDETKCLAKYLFDLINNKIFNEYLGNNSNGATYPTCSKNDVYNFNIAVPNINEQKKIIDVFENIYLSIELKKDELIKMDELVKSQFITEFGNVNLNSKFFHQDKLINHLNVLGGYAFDSKKYLDEGVPVLRIGNINTGSFIPKELRHWRFHDNLNRYLVLPGDLLITLTGTVGKDDYGNVCIIDNSFPIYYLNQRNAKLEVFETLNPVYLKFLLANTSIKNRLTGISRGVRQANISNKDILNLKVPIPPIELQNQFADFVKQIDKSKFIINQQLEELKNLLNSQMQKYFG